MEMSNSSIYNVMFWVEFMMTELKRKVLRVAAEAVWRTEPFLLVLSHHKKKISRC